ncbi:AAA family ATPase [Megasphaera sp.]|uniref:AAA family ATPase n=1 Tax=Megasphaera sp. TaxID=2023260 RepID=UPI0035206266
MSTNYLLTEDYSSGILCIDEIDVSLHPDAQQRLIDLLDKLSSELNLQIIISSHSLVIIKEILKTIR